MTQYKQYKYGNIDLKDKVSIVTGASGDIGSAICEALLEREAYVNAVYNKNKEPLDNLVNLYSERIKLFQLDFLSDDFEKEIENYVKSVYQKHKKLDILINCAGIWEVTRFVDETPELRKRLMRINFEAPYVFSKSAFRYMLGRPGIKHIINIGSIAGVRGVAQQVSYSASKGALRTLTQAIAEEGANYGINVNCVSPGAVDSKAISKYFPDEKAKKLWAKSIPKYSLCKVEDVVNACLAILMNNYLTGAEIILHGGREPLMK